jgi:hypothetical protein
MEQMAAKMSAKKLQRLQKVCLLSRHRIYLQHADWPSDKDDQRRSTDSSELLWLERQLLAALYDIMYHIRLQAKPRVRALVI